MISIFDMIAEDPKLSGELASFSHTSQERMPAGVKAGRDTSVIAYSLSKTVPCLCLYLTLNAEKIKFPETGRKSFVFIGNTDLEALTNECERELDHRGFRFNSTTQTADGKIIAKTYKFEDDSNGFSRELLNIVDYLRSKHRL